MTARPSLVIAVVSVIGVVACTDEPGNADDAAATATTSAAAPTTTEPRPDDDPFCRAMLELARAGDDEGEPSVADLIEAYEDIQRDVPDAIRAEFDTVLARMRLRAADQDPEVPEVADEAALNLSAYIDANCRRTARTPLPAPTAPVPAPSDGE
jgi:hypothetical protein